MEDVNDSLATDSVSLLCALLHTELKDRNGIRLGAKPVVLMDEYDAFLQDMGRVPPERFNEVIKALSRFMVATFKSNMDFTVGVVTGILRLSQTGMLSGLNNPNMHDIFDEGTGGFFGYTENEVEGLIRGYVPDPFRSKAMAYVREIYDGYLFGGTEVYNPRSVNMYLAGGRFDVRSKEYWEQSRRNQLLDSLLSSVSESVQDRIAGLAAEKDREMSASIEASAVYQDLYCNPSETALVSCLVTSGYLKARPVDEVGTSAFECMVSVPSLEMAHAYDGLMSRARARKVKGDSFLDALYSCDSTRATEEFNRHLSSMSVRDGWGHDRCKQHLADYFSSRMLDAKTEAETGNGYADVFVGGDRSNRAPDVCIEITTSEETGTGDLARIEQVCWDKFANRMYCSDRPDALLVAFAWDRKTCRVGIRKSGEFFRRL